MAKRFIDTDLFRKPFMRSLEAPYKALWIYLLCECDHAGIWVVELDVAQIRMGLKLDPDKVLEKMQGAVVSVDGGRKWYLPDFVPFQYGTLNPDNRVHASALSRLEALGINPSESKENKPLTSPLQGDKDKDKDTIEEEERASENQTPESVLEWPAWAGERTRAKWAEFIAYRRREHSKRYKSPSTEQKALNLACKYFPSGPLLVTALEHSMAKGWQFPVDPAEHKYPEPNIPGVASARPVWNPRA